MNYYILNPEADYEIEFLGFVSIFNSRRINKTTCVASSDAENVWVAGNGIFNIENLNYGGVRRRILSTPSTNLVSIDQSDDFEQAGTILYG